MLMDEFYCVCDLFFFSQEAYVIVDMTKQSKSLERQKLENMIENFEINFKNVCLIAESDQSAFATKIIEYGFS